MLKHAQILRSTGFDVTLLTEQDQEPGFVDFAGARFFALSTRRTILDAYFDKLVTTLWSTCPWGNAYVRAKVCYYLVQNFETDFYEPGDFFRLIANSTYSRYPNLRYITISRWCEKWLKERFGQDAVYAPNGIDLTLFQYAARNFSNEKIRVLIEGDSESPYKNIDEAFRIANRLNREKYEVWYLSYQGRPKPWYRFEKFLHKVSYDQVADVYHACHILLKTSILESFSYPPLEMMATRGLVVVRPNGGNLEYLRDQENCLMYRENDIDHAQECIERLVSDSKLREMLIENGRATARARSWDAIKDQVLQVYT
ncbi:MAG: glycosyltransferase family 4 protein [Nitrosomonas sp.]|nr:glycosyltransferase family 4 protein [Nitrosomonas sp.]